MIASPASTLQLANRNWDFGFATRTVWGEARSESDIGQQAVAHVIINRLASRHFGTTFAQVCTSKFQFDCWLQTDPNWRQMLALTDIDAGLMRCVRNFNAALLSATDFTDGALYYYSPAGGFPFPPAFRQLTFIDTFGTQKFYK